MSAPLLFRHHLRKIKSMESSRKSIHFYKKVFVLAMPIALQSLITIGVNMLDTMMVGKLGDDPLSATSLANSFISVFQIFCMGLGMGASVLVSRYWGMKSAAKDEQVSNDSTRALKQTVCLMLRLNISLALLFALATLVMPGIIMRMYTEEEQIVTYGVTYFRYSVLRQIAFMAAPPVPFAPRSAECIRRATEAAPRD